MTLTKKIEELCVIMDRKFRIRPIVYELNCKLSSIVKSFKGKFVIISMFPFEIEIEGNRRLWEK
jgi:hypothetical protein